VAHRAAEGTPAGHFARELVGAEAGVGVGVAAAVLEPELGTQHTQQGREFGRKRFGSIRRSKHRGCLLVGGRNLPAVLVVRIRRSQLVEHDV
jgi:hypothetical protein